MLYRLIYVSRVARHVRFADAQAIAERAVPRNTQDELTGLLLYTPTHFVQVLEGPQSRVHATFQRLSTDPRHSDIRVVSEGPIAARNFGRWAMAMKVAPAGLSAADLDALDDERALLLFGA